MGALRNVFACLVHESPECVADLVRNLRALDPSSEILLYNGGKDRSLLAGFPFERYGAIVHPHPKPHEWGRLHEFALDCMRFCLSRPGFDTLTIVDSDQLAARPGYSEHLARALAARSGVGLFGSSPGPQPRPSRIGPVASAHRELDLWRPWLRRFPDGEEKFVHWTFWPSTVITADASRDLLQLLASDAELQGILRQSRIWATEEILLPTLIALLGYEIAAHPCSYDFVKYKETFSRKQIEGALARPDVFWIHPVLRRYDDPLRKLIRERLGHYHGAAASGPAPAGPETDGPGLLPTLPVLERMRQIPGWLEDEEADLLLAGVSRALTDLPAPHTVVEVGSYCGRSTVVLGSAVQALRPAGRVHAIDPHLGQVGALDQGLQSGTPTFEKLRANLAANGLTDTVQVVRKCSFEVDWQGPISFLLIDGLHDYVNVARDFFHFEAAVVPGGYVAFHDYADYYPGVRTFVDELLATGRYRKVHLAKSLLVVRKLAASEVRPAAPAPAVSIATVASVTNTAVVENVAIVADGAALRAPLVSCIMPTRDRRELVPQAVRQFLRQDWPNAELIVIDDGNDKVADLIPADPRIRYIALDERRTVGAKRNLACEAARGEIILHWDDDDWMADWRIRYQVEHLLAARADLCGLPRLYFHEPATGQTWEFISPARDRKWIAGATFCYRKDLWRAVPFADVDNGEDMRFLWSDRRKKVEPLGDPSFYIARLHPANTASKRDSTRSWRPVRERVLARLLAGMEGMSLLAAEPDPGSRTPAAVP